MLLNRRLDSLWIRAHNLIDFLAVLEQQESGHGADAELLGEVGDLVHVDLVESDVGVFFGVSVVASH